MRLCMTGQLFYGTDRGGCLFSIWSDNHNGPYTAYVISPTAGHIVVEQDEFKTVGEAAAWIYKHCEY